MTDERRETRDEKGRRPERSEGPTSSRRLIFRRPGRALPPKGERFRELLKLLRDEADRRFALAELHDLLVGCAPVEYADVVARADHSGLPVLMQNYVAAMVEQAGVQKGVAPPAWVAEIAPLDQPHFATPLKSVRFHLLRASPVPFKRRNIFIDASLGARV